MARQIMMKNQLLSVGDTVVVSQRIKEGEKERTQSYEGVLIAIKGNSGERTISVRKIAVGGIGVERVFPVDLPGIEKIRIVRSSNVRRSKLYYLRTRVGKAALKLKEHVDKKTTAPDSKPRARKPRGSGRASAV